MDDRFQVAVGAGTMMSGSATAARFPHRWTPGGVTVEADFTGGHLLHLAAAGCVLNDVYREAAALGIRLKGVRLTAGGGFNTETWQSTGIDYAVEVSVDAPPISSRTCSRWSTGWPRFPAPSEPEPPSDGSIKSHRASGRPSLHAPDRALAAAEADDRASAAAAQHTVARLPGRL